MWQFLPLTGANVLVGIVLGKVLALTIGPSGSGDYYLALSWIGFGGLIASAGLGPAISNALSAPNGRSDSGQRREALRVALVLSSLGSAVVIAIAIVVILGIGETRTQLAGGPLVALVIVGIAPTAWLLVLQGALRGSRDFDAYLRFGLIVSASNLTLTSLGAVILGVNGAVLGSIVVSTIGIAFGLNALRRWFAFDRPQRTGSWSPGYGRERGVRTSRILLEMGALALLGAAATSLGQVVSRAYLAHAVGIAAVGYFGASWAISNRLPGLVYQTFSTYLTPTLSALRGDLRAVQAHQESTLLAGVAVATPMLIVMSCGTGILIPVLLSNEFMPMEALLRLMLVGEVMSILYWSLTVALFSTGRTSASAGFEWLWWGLFVVGVVALEHLVGLDGVGVAYIIAYAVGSAVLAVYEHRRMGWYLSMSTSAILFSAIASTAIAPVVATKVVTSDFARLAVGMVIAFFWCLGVILFNQQTRDLAMIFWRRRSSGKLL